MSVATTKIEVVALAVCGVGLESFTCKLKLDVPAAVGEPVIAPVELFKLSPVGKEPKATLHVYGVIPPVAEAVEAYELWVIPPGNAEKLMVSGATDAPTLSVSNSAAV